MYNMSKEIQLSSLSLEFYIDNDVRSEHHGHADDAGAKGGLYTLDIFPQDHGVTALMTVSYKIWQTLVEVAVTPRGRRNMIKLLTS